MSQPPPPRKQPAAAAAASSSSASKRAATSAASSVPSAGTRGHALSHHAASPPASAARSPASGSKSSSSRKRAASPGALRPVRASTKPSYANSDLGPSSGDEYDVSEPSLGAVGETRKAWVPAKKRKDRQTVKEENKEEEQEDEMEDDEEEADASAAAASGTESDSDPSPRASRPGKRGAGAAAAASSSSAAAAGGSGKKPAKAPPGLSGTSVKHTPAEIEAATAKVVADIQALPITPTPTVISLFTEKGGVGKTSSTLALGWALAAAGRRVLLVDCDGQRSLSSWALGLEVQANPFKGNLTAFINQALPAEAENALPRTLFDQMWSVAQQNRPLLPAHAIELAPRLHLVPGHRETLSFDKEINRTEALGKVNFIPVNNVTGLPYAAVMRTAAAVQAEFVLLDLNPNAGDLNRVLISTSHFILMPTIPDFFCCELLGGFETRLMGWVAEMEAARALTMTGPFPLPLHVAKFLGILVSRYQIRESGYLENGITNDKLAHQEQLWLTKVTEKATMLVAALAALVPPRAVQPAVYAGLHRTCVLGMYKDFHTLGDIAHVAHRPVPFLTDADIQASLRDTRAQQTNGVKIRHSKLIFMETAKSILMLCKA